MMRLAIIRQRYTPYGGAERFVESALEALLERNVAITLYTREWPETRLKLIEPRIIDPFFVGRVWRDYGFARAVSREVGRAHLDLVQSHERLLACDVYRAGDGVHAVWLDERLRGAPWWKRLGVRLNPWHRYVLATERRLFASPLLQAVICNSSMVRDEIRQTFGVADEKLRLIYNAVDAQVFSPALREWRGATREKLGIGTIHSSTSSSVPASSARARRPRSRRWRNCPHPPTWSSSAAKRIWRAMPRSCGDSASRHASR